MVLTDAQQAKKAVRQKSHVRNAKQNLTATFSESLVDVVQQFVSLQLVADDDGGRRDWSMDPLSLMELQGGRLVLA